MILCSCANPLSPTSNTNSTDLTAQTALAAGLTNAKVTFHYSDFYSLTSPNDSGCAGDAKNYTDAILGSAFQTSLLDATTTIRPSFIKNISVDITDSNTNVSSNLAQHCSYGSGPNAPTASNCATFDYGADEGITSSLSGSVVIIGGMNNTQLNSAVPEVSCSSISAGATNSCPVSAYALAVDALSSNAATNPPNSLVPGIISASGPISTWGSLSANTGYNGPTSLTGAAGGYDAGTGLYALFGGTSLLPTTGALAQATSLDSTWSFDLKTQLWTLQASNPVVAAAFKETYDQEGGTPPEELVNFPTARANFGYVALPGIALSSMSIDGGIHPTGANANVDTADRIIIFGGQDSSFNPAGGVGYLADAYKFNPTYGPELFDVMASSNGTAPSGQLVQWLGNYQSQIIENGNPASLFSINYPTPNPSGSTLPSSSFGATALHNATAPYAGYVLAVGGFDSTLFAATTGSSNAGCILGALCAMSISSRALDDETHTANFTSVGNLPESISTSDTEFLPTVWTPYRGATTTDVYWYGGSSLLPGFDLATNDVVYFGGSTCANYLVAGETGCDFANPGGYYHMSGTPAPAASTIPSVPAKVAFAGTAPARAGMASARGLDPSGNPIDVAFGGMRLTGISDDFKIYYLYNAGGTTPTWTSTTGSNSPTPLTGASLVFSHVTGKFYLFGGFSVDQNIMEGDTWELTVSGANCGLNGNCTFVWTQLDVPDGLACSLATCPAARRGHRMVEVNYNNLNPNLDPNGAAGTYLCTKASPCSFGLFMEGGTPDGVNELGDRWLFDPTANSGYGLWQKMSDMPARTLASMTSVDYTIAETGVSAHRAVLFGGEMGLQNPVDANPVNTSSVSFVAPTLGDTWIYDYGTSTWNRVNLLGQGYNGANPGLTTEISHRQAYNAAAPGKLSVLTPPPTAGGMMVTRTQNGPTITTPAPALALPEVFLLGGRNKDGSFRPFSQVYKFCIASTGEAYTGGSGVGDSTPNTSSSQCDSFDAINNPFSPSPLDGASGYSGRWLRKTPLTGGTPSTFTSYLGAAAYDSIDDLVVVYGGYQAGTGTYVTDTANRVFSANADVYEYTPPPSQTSDGTWADIPACSATKPLPRYGHSLSYDAKNQQLILVGGYSPTGIALTSTIEAANGAYNIPEVWTAKRNSAGPCYDWTPVNVFGNNPTDVPGLANGLGFFSALYIPATGYNTGFYSMFDSSCIGSGPIASTDPLQNKLLAGGVYFDIDRTQLGTYENLILNLTFVPLGQGSQSPNVGSMTAADEAVFRVDLVTTGQSNSTLEGVLQPRFLTYTDNTQFPVVVQTLDVLAPPTGQVRQEQLLIPLSVNPAIDRIRIERVSGSGILIDASLFRMGVNEN